MDNTTILDIGRQFEVECKDHGFVLLGPGAERHGSLEWAVHRNDASLHRFIILALTPYQTPNGAERLYTGEVWIAADDNARFTRHLVAEFNVPEKKLLKHAVLSSRATFFPPLNDAIATAIERVLQLAVDDLKEVHVRPHAEPAEPAGI